MSVIFLLIPLSVVIAVTFLGAFIWAVRSGQYEDTYTPSVRLLTGEPEVRPKESLLKAKSSGAHLEPKARLEPNLEPIGGKAAQDASLNAAGFLESGTNTAPKAADV